MTVACVDQQATRYYSAAYFNEAEAHWRRMVANSSHKLRQFSDCLVEGANSARIAGYDRNRFQAVFTRIAQDNDMASGFGGLTHSRPSSSRCWNTTSITTHTRRRTLPP